MDAYAGRLIIPDGWGLADQFSEQSAVVNVAAGAGVNATVPQVVVSKDVPTGAKIYIRQLSFRVVDQAGFDQLIFALRKNGAKLAPWDAISGEQVVDEHVVPVEQAFDPGLIDIAASNISGQGLSGSAADAVAIRVIARFSGYLLKRLR